MVPLALTFVVLVLAAAIAVWSTASGAAVILSMLPSVGLMGLTTALLQGGLFGLAGLCPPIYVQVGRRCRRYACHLDCLQAVNGPAGPPVEPVVKNAWGCFRMYVAQVIVTRSQATSVGQAVAGFGVSVLSFGTIWAAPGLQPGEVRAPADVAWSAFAYFCVSAIVIAASAAGYWVLQHSPFWHHYTSAQQISGHHSITQSHASSIADKGPPSNEHFSQGIIMLRVAEG